MDWTTIIAAAVPGVVALVVAAWAWVKARAAQTPAKWDDRAVEFVEDVIRGVRTRKDGSTKPIVALAAAAVVLTLMAGGCTPYATAAIDATERTIENIKRVNDAEANVLKQAPCTIDIGAYYRVLDSREQGAVAALCGGSGESTVRVGDLRAIMGVLERR